MKLIDFIQFLGFKLLVLLLIGYLIGKFISLFIGKTKCYFINDNDEFSLFGKVSFSAILDSFKTNDYRLGYEFQQNGHFKVKNNKDWLSLMDHSKEMKDGDTPEEVGFVDKDGKIYDTNGLYVGYIGNKKGEPTIWGERKWYELFLRCHGYVFLCMKQTSVVHSEDGQSGEASQPEHVCIGKCIEYGRFKRPKRITSLAKGAAFTIFSKLHELPDQDREVVRRRYLWYDTVLVAALAYSFVYVFIYLLTDSFTLFSFLGEQIGFVVTMLAVFGVIWAIMRSIKIELSLRGSPVAHTLMLFNRNTGVSAMGVIIPIAAFIAIVYTLFFAGSDLLPLLIVICFGVSWNRKHVTAAPWEVSDELDSIDEADLDLDLDLDDPTDGKVEKRHEWRLDPIFGNLHGSLTLKMDSELIERERAANPFRLNPYPSTDHYTSAKKLLESSAYHRGYLRQVVRYINQRAKTADLLDIEKIQFILDFTQAPNIAYMEDDKSDEIGNLEDYARTPNETLFDKRGDCDCKAVLAATLFREAGYPSAYILLPGHAAIGVAITGLAAGSDASPLSPYLKLNGRNYYFCETTGENWIVGDYSTNTPDKVEQVICLEA